MTAPRHGAGLKGDEMCDKRCKTCKHCITDGTWYACTWQPQEPWPYWREEGGAKMVDPNAKECPAWEQKEKVRP